MKLSRDLHIKKIVTLKPNLNQIFNYGKIISRKKELMVLKSVSLHLVSDFPIQFQLKQQLYSNFQA